MTLRLWRALLVVLLALVVLGGGAWLPACCGLSRSPPRTIRPASSITARSAMKRRRACPTGSGGFCRRYSRTCCPPTRMATAPLACSGQRRRNPRRPLDQDARRDPEGCPELRLLPSGQLPSRRGRRGATGERRPGNPGGSAELHPLPDPIGQRSALHRRPPHAGDRIDLRHAALGAADLSLRSDPRDAEGTSRPGGAVCLDGDTAGLGSGPHRPLQSGQVPQFAPPRRWHDRQFRHDALMGAGLGRGDTAAPLRLALGRSADRSQGDGGFGRDRRWHGLRRLSCNRTRAPGHGTFHRNDAAAALAVLAQAGARRSAACRRCRRGSRPSHLRPRMRHLP